MPNWLSCVSMLGSTKLCLIEVCLVLAGIRNGVCEVDDGGFSMRFGWLLSMQGE